MMTASKILSLWAKHGEQEQEMERLDGETKALNREAETREEAEAAALSPAAAGAAGGGADDDTRSTSSRRWRCRPAASG